MRKNKSITYTYFLLAVFLILIVPGSILAQQAEETEEAVKIIQLIPLKKNFFAFFGKTFPSLLIKLLPIIAMAAFIKVWLLKRKFSISWKWTDMEKLSLGALAETVVGVFFLFLVIAFFTPGISSVLTDILKVKVTFADTPGGQTLMFFIHTLVALPFYCFISGLIIVVLIHLIKPTEIKKEKQGRYYKYGVFLALITPVLLVVFVFIGRVLLKWSYV